MPTCGASFPVRTLKLSAQTGLAQRMLTAMARGQQAHPATGLALLLGFCWRFGRCAGRDRTPPEISSGSIACDPARLNDQDPGEKVSRPHLPAPLP